MKRAHLRSEEAKGIFDAEVSIMRRLSHPNIVKLLDVEPPQPGDQIGSILMEYCPGGHLLAALKSLQGKKMRESALLNMLSHVVSAVRYLHEKDITHRDLKLENILRSAGGEFKLCDFGSCVQGKVPLETSHQRSSQEEVVEKTTTQMYRAPEMVDLYMERELTAKVDIWALGCILYAAAYLKHPFQDAGNLGILNARIKIPEDSPFSVGLNDAIHRMLAPSPGSRPDIKE
ncbi:unnamed protein product, partial [Discosporangium mesarthrocarpum]